MGRSCVALLSLMLLFISSIPEARAADVRPYISGSGGFRTIVIEGTIERGDYELFLKIVRENQARVSGVYLFTPGGDFQEAMRIGKALRDLALFSQVPMRDINGRARCDAVGSGPTPNSPQNCVCASACFFIHIGATHRGGTYISVHRPYLVKQVFSSLSQEDAKRSFERLQYTARTYMSDMGVPNHLQEEVLGTPSDQAVILDERTIKTYFWGSLPYFDEWVKSRCPDLSPPEARRIEGYANRPRGIDLSQSELQDFQALSQKQSEQSACVVAISEEARIKAFEKFFGSKPSDVLYQDFSEWTRSARYLGMHFYAIMQNERFEQENNTPGWATLKRPATASSPSISLDDTEKEPKVVYLVVLVSTPNPSPDYVRNVLKAASDAWGRNSGGNGLTKWSWNLPGFSANLEYQQKSADGPYLSLMLKRR